MQRALIIFMVSILFGCQTTSNISKPDIPTRSDQEIQQVFMFQKDVIFGEYKKELLNEPQLKGSVDFFIKVHKNGDVKECKNKVSVSLLLSLADKICAIIQTMNFGEGEEVIEPYSINFLPE